MNEILETLKSTEILTNCQYTFDTKAFHYNLFLANAGLYFELSISKEFKWSLSINGLHYEGTTINTFVDLADELKRQIKGGKLVKAKIKGSKKDEQAYSSIKDYYIPVYVWDLEHVVAALNTEEEFNIQYWNKRNEALCGAFLLRDIQSIAGVTCIEDLQESFLKVEKMENSALFATFSEIAFKTMLVTPSQNSGVGKLFKTAASKAKYEIMNYANKKIHGKWMRRVVPYPAEYDYIRHQCFRASVVMASNQSVKRVIDGKEEFDAIVFKNAVSWDQASAHAHKAICKTFPMSKPYEPKDTDPDWHDWHKGDGFNYYLNNYYCWFTIEFGNLRCKEGMFHLDPFNTHVNFGSRDMTMHLDKNQWLGFKQFYTWDYMIITRMVVSKEAYLPDNARKAIAKLYIDKATYPTKDAIRNMLKILLNSASYGCMIERIWDYYDDDGKVKKFTNDQWYKIWDKRILPPQVGTTIATYVILDELNIIAQIAGDFAYCDTDSIKAVDSEKLTGIIEKHNAKVDTEIKAACEKLDLTYDIMKDLGKYQNDGKYNRLKTISKKEYIYETAEGKLGAHCAGYASHFPNYDFDDADTSIVFKYFTKRFFEPNKDMFEKSRIPVVLFEPLYKQQDPFDYFTKKRKYTEYVNEWVTDKKRFAKSFYKLNIDEWAKYVKEHTTEK